MVNTIFRVQSHKFTQENIQTTLVCSNCDEVFTKEFLLDLEGQTIEFKTSDSKVIDSKSYENLLQNELSCMDIALNRSDKISFIKIVFTNSTTLNEVRDLLSRVFERPNISNLSGLTLQPSYQFDSPSTKQILKIYDEVCSFYKDVRVIPQMHKLLDMS